MVDLRASGDGKVLDQVPAAVVDAAENSQAVPADGGPVAREAQVLRLDEARRQVACLLYTSRCV